MQECTSLTLSNKDVRESEVRLDFRSVTSWSNVLSQILITVGLLLDIVGVALLLAGPRVHLRASFLALEGDETSSNLPGLRRIWSKLGRFGLPIVTVGFALQILGTWAGDMQVVLLALLLGIALPLVFLGALVVVWRLPFTD